MSGSVGPRLARQLREHCVSATSECVGTVPWKIGLLDNGDDFPRQVALYYYNLGNLYTKRRFSQQALASLNKATALAPRNMAVRQNLGYCMCQFQLYSQAVNEFQEMLEMDPHWNMARPCLIDALNRMGRQVEANQVKMDYKLYKSSDDSGDDGDGDGDDSNKNGVHL